MYFPVYIYIYIYNKNTGYTIWHWVACRHWPLRQAEKEKKKKEEIQLWQEQVENRHSDGDARMCSGTVKGKCDQQASRQQLEEEEVLWGVIQEVNSLASDPQTKVSVRDHGLFFSCSNGLKVTRRGEGIKLRYLTFLI